MAGILISFDDMFILSSFPSFVNSAKKNMDRFADTGDEDAVARREDLGILHEEGRHAPVDAVGAAALGGVLPGEVGRLP
jgi:hypothetical protein